MIVLPFRAKNVPERRPYVTMTLILINVIVFAFTVDGTLHVREDALDALAVSHSHLTLFRLLTAMFLHGSLMHILGNMWFLWLFGSTVEGRMGSWRYLGMYIFAGLVGSLLHDIVVGLHNPDQPTLGASGAIMGVAGAYLYVFPYATIRLFWWIGFRPGITEWHARWVVLYFIGLDVLNGVLLQSADGVAHLAHIGGFAAGIIACGVLQVKRDSEDFSAAQAVRADVKDPDLLSAIDLEVLLQYPTDNMRLVLAYCNKVLLLPGVMGEQKCLGVLRQYLRPLLEGGDPHRLAAIVLRLDTDSVRTLPTVALLRLGSILEQAGNYDYAVRIYRRLVEVNARSADAEVALHRTGRLYDQVFRDPANARFAYSELLRLFPNGVFAEEIRRTGIATPGNDNRLL